MSSRAHGERAYAATIDSAQGITVDQTVVLVGPDMDRRRLYSASRWNTVLRLGRHGEFLLGRSRVARRRRGVGGLSLRWPPPFGWRCLSTPPCSISCGPSKIPYGRFSRIRLQTTAQFLSNY
jgi:hypothetical protein